MSLLYERLRQKVNAWRTEGHHSDTYPAVPEILNWIEEPGAGAVRFLRKPQVEALEIYWFLRLFEGTPHTFDLYRSIWSENEDPEGLLSALGVPDEAFKAAKFQFASLWKRLREDDGFVGDFGLEALRETLTLDYPSYIFALAMGLMPR